MARGAHPAVDRARRTLPVFCAVMPALLISCAGAQETRDYAAMRERMVRTQIESSLFGREPVRDEAVLAAMRKVPRHEFVPQSLADDAYTDSPLPIGYGQTISQPYIVARMTEAIAPKPGEKVLEIGTGSGYQAAVLAEIVEEIYTIEIVEPLGSQAKAVLEELGYKNVQVRIGDGYRGWPEAAPFDAIVVTAAPDHVPQPLLDQLATGGRMVIPVGAQGGVQELVLIRKSAGGAISRTVLDLVRFVPLTGEAER